jgi:uncharacterized protein (TIGR02246 family)
MLTIWLLTVALQASQPQTTRSSGAIPAEARAAIAQANNEWLPAMKRQDAKAIAEPYADEAVFVLATGESVKGRAAIEQLMRERFRRIGSIAAGTLQQDDLVAAGSMIYEWGHADLEVVSAPGQAPSRSVGRYLTVWQKDASGRWRIIRNLSLGN